MYLDCERPGFPGWPDCGTAIAELDRIGCTCLRAKFVGGVPALSALFPDGSYTLYARVEDDGRVAPPLRWKTLLDDGSGSVPDLGPCPHCGRGPVDGGADACLGRIKGVNSACCGHGGRSRSYARKGSGRYVQHEEAEAWFRELGLDVPAARKVGSPRPKTVGGVDIRVSRRFPLGLGDED